MYLSECVICHQPITHNFSLCRTHEATYGHNRKEWPQWLLFLVRETEKERKREKQRHRYEEEIDDIYIRSCQRLASEGMRGYWAGATPY